MFAEAHHADLFISLHFNSAAPDQNQAGLETYCLTPTGMSSTVMRGYADFWSDNYSNNAFDAQNLQIAVRLHAALLRPPAWKTAACGARGSSGCCATSAGPPSSSKPATCRIQHEAKLIECPDYRQKLAEAIAAALR